MSILTLFGGTRSANKPLLVGDRIDHVTGLPSRLHVVEMVGATLKDARRKAPVSLLIVDFSNIHDGDPRERDALLPDLANMMRSYVPSEHLVGRLRDREFAVLVSNGLALRQVEHLAYGVVEEARTTPLLGGRQRYIATHVGIGHSTKADCKAPELLRNADIALSRARATAQAHYSVVDRVPS